MKKILSTIVAGGLLLTSTPANAAVPKASDLPRAVKSYEASMLKTVKAYDRDGWKPVTLYKGQKVTIVQRKYINGYDFLITKGNVYFPISNSTVKIIKPVSGKVNYDAYHMTPQLKQELKKLGTSHRDYQAYKKAAVNYERGFKETEGYMFVALLARTLHHNEIIPGGLETPPYVTYKSWIAEKRPSYDYSGYKCNVASKYKINVLSNAFVKEYMNNNFNLRGMYPGKAWNYKMGICKLTGTKYGYFYSQGNVGYTFKAGYKMKNIGVIPTQKVTYKQAINFYGKPSSVQYVTNGVHETIATYNADKYNGYKVVMGFDKYKGNMKYMIKFKD
ncbi:hypothetical protein [Macrococcus equi]|uniref:hypothetical protein n=1 Tax=Macrococcus equi TaxID=3395462 RepID=UPI0039BE1883